MKIGIDIGGSHIGVGLVNNTGDILAKKELNLVEEDKIDANNKIISYINKLIIKVLEIKDANIDDIELIGIASPGVIKKGIIVKADNLNLNKFNIVGELKKKYNVPIYLDNDAKCAAIAEKEYGNLKGYVDSVFLCIGTGIGGAVFWDGHLLESARSPGFELGHMTIDIGGRKCSCGNNGCFEAYSSIGNLRKIVAERMGLEKSITGKQLVEILKKYSNNIIVGNVLDEYIRHFSVGLANIINIFEPEIIVLGGSIVYYEDIIIDRTKELLRKSKLIYNEDIFPKISMARLKNDAGIVGATIIRKSMNKLT